MKRFLLGGTALAAASVIAPDAKAEGGMKLGIGGHIAAADEFANQNGGRSDAGYQPTSDQLNVGEEIYFKGRATLDNGLTMGAHVDLQGGRSQIEERWIYLQGGWGELRLGDAHPGLVATLVLPARAGAGDRVAPPIQDVPQKVA